MNPAPISINSPLLSRIVTFVQELDARVAARPRLALAIAVGVGFALGGTLTTRIGRIILAAAAREGVKRMLASA